MSYSIVTYGFGPNSSIYAIPVYGFNIIPPYRLVLSFSLHVTQIVEMELVR